MNSMDEICVPVIKKILGHYLELNPNYNNEKQNNNPEYNLNIIQRS